MKTLCNQLIHRFKTTKILLVVYAFTLMNLWVCFMQKNVLSYSRDEKSIYESLSMKETLLSLLLGIILLLVVCSFKMFRDYKSGDMRWHLLSKHTNMIVLGDILFIVLAMLVLYVLYYVMLYLGIKECIKAFDPQVMKAFFLNDVNSLFQDNEIRKELFPMDLMRIVRNLSILSLECSLLVCAVRFFIKERKNFCDLILIVIGILVVLCPIKFHPGIQIMTALILTGFYFYEACKTWRYKNVKN